MNPTIRSFLSQLLEGKHFNVCLDLGCGEGYYSQTIKEHCNFLIGVDHNLPRLSVAARFGRYDQLFLADIREYEPPLETEAAFLLDVIEHIPKEDGVKLLEKLEKMPNMKFIFLSTPETFTTKGYRNHHVTLWTMPELHKLGFATTTIKNPIPLNLICETEILAWWEKVG